MARNDDQVSRRTTKLVFQQCDSRCAFCGVQAIELLDLHHLVPRRDGGSNEPENLIVACKNCHARIECGEITSEQVFRRKRIVSSGLRVLDSGNSTTFQINAPVSDSIVAQTVHIHAPKKTSLKVAYPAGTIGARLEMKNYVDHLVSRYYEFREADAIYGRASTFSYAVIHKNIQRRFGAKTFYVPEILFGDLVEYLQRLIDRTIQGRVNRSHARANYSNFEDYLSKYTRA